MGDPDVIYLPTVEQPSSLLQMDFRVVFDTAENISMRVGVMKNLHRIVYNCSNKDVYC